MHKFLPLPSCFSTQRSGGATENTKDTERNTESGKKTGGSFLSSFSVFSVALHRCTTYRRFWIFAFLFFAALSGSTLFAQPQTPPSINPVGPGINDTLDALKDRGRNLQDFTADVTIKDSDPITGSDHSKMGRILFQRKPDGDSRIRVMLDRKTIADRIVKSRADYKLEDGKLIDQNFESKPKHQITRQVLKPGQKLDPLKLGEGPFPLPIGQDREEVLKNFEVTQLGPDKDDPTDLVHLVLKPKTGTRFAKKFELIDVFVDQKSKFPVRIVTVDKGGASVHTTDLSNLKINPGLKDGDFTLTEPGKDWDITDESLPE